MGPMAGSRGRAGRACVLVPEQNPFRLDDVLAAVAVRKRRTYCGRDCADLCDLLATRGALGRVFVADEEGFGCLPAGAAVYRVYSGRVIRTVGGPDPTVPGGASGWTVVEFPGRRLHDRAHVRSGRSGGHLFVRSGVSPKALPHHDVFVRAGVLSMGATLAIGVFAGAVRVAGGAVARFARSTVGLLSKSAGESIATKIIGFRDGLNALSSARRFRRGGAAVLACGG